MSQSVSVHVQTPSGQHTLESPPESPEAPESPDAPEAAKNRALLSELLAANHLALNTRCGQRGLCDGCLVELIEGQLQHHATQELVHANGQPVNVRACEYKLSTASAAGNSVTLRIAPRSLLSHRPQVVSTFQVNVPYAQDPIWQCVRIASNQFPANWITQKNAAQTLVAAVQRAINCDDPLTMDTELLATMARHAQQPTDYEITLEMLPQGRVISRFVEAKETISATPALGVAVDIGTTTVALLLVELTTGKVVGKASGFNHQTHLGDNVITRINRCMTDPKALGELQKSVVSHTLVPLVAEALKQAQAKPDQIKCACIGANTTMLHLFAGVDPTSMGIAPFTPSFVDHVLAPALPKIMPATSKVHLLPSCSAYVGADLTAGMLATGLMYDDGPNLLVDVGTNGEIILKHHDQLLGCATAAGPAFEGAGLSSGLRAVDGAVSHFRVTGQGPSALLEYQSISSHSHEDHWHATSDHPEKNQTLGICGSAYIDLLAELRRARILSASGRFEFGQDENEHPMFEAMVDGYRGFVVSRNHKRKSVLITERDIASLLQAKAAIAAGILTLLNRVGLLPSQIKTLYLAGGFGLHLNVRNTIDCGLLPGFVPEQIKVVGNTSLAGAYVGMLDSGALAEMRRAARKLEAVELNLDPGFEDLYIDQLCLP